MRRQAVWTHATGIMLAIVWLATSPVSVEAWKTVFASDFGYQTQDATAALQAAINSGADCVMVTKQSNDWVVGPIRLASHQILIFDPQVVVTAKAGAFQGVSDCLFSAKNQTDITLLGAGAVWRMRKADYAGAGYAYSQWRHTLQLLSCSNVRVEGLLLRDSGGDGIFIGSDIHQPPCRNITVRDVKCVNNYRQGISVTSVEDLLLENCSLRETSGTGPQAGIDFEPDYADQVLVNCVVRHCRFEHNAQAAALVYPVHLTAASTQISITFDDCFFTSASGWGLQVDPWPNSGVMGTVTFQDCLVENVSACGLYVNSKAANRGLLRFVRCTWRNVAANSVNGLPRNPICLTGEFSTLAPEYGGLEFQDCVVDDVQNRPSIITFEPLASSGCANLQGTLILRHANSEPLRLGSKAHANTLVVRVQAPDAPHSAWARPAPNPVKTQLYFYLDNLGLCPVDISLYNPAGERVYQQNYTADVDHARLTCDLGALAPGIYFYVLRHQGQTEKGKICVKK